MSYSDVNESWGQVTAATIRQLLYSPIGLTAQMNGQTPIFSHVFTPGGGALHSAGSNGGGSRSYLHSDWLGSARLSTLIGNRTASYDTAFGPYGETYDSFGTVTPVDFTGDPQNIFSGLFDTPNRELAQYAGRWNSPDPARASWNAYAYPTDPNRQTDPTGLCDADANGVCNDPHSVDPGCNDANCVTVSEGGNDHITISDHFHNGGLDPQSEKALGQQDYIGVGTLIRLMLTGFGQTLDYLKKPIVRCVCGGINDASLVPLLFRVTNNFKGFEPEQGFSGVYDKSTGKTELVPSTYDPDVPDGWVSANGGHARVSADLGGDPNSHYGFSAVLQEDGSLQLKFKSGVLNGAYPNAEVPLEIQPEIVEAVETMTEVPVVP